MSAGLLPFRSSPSRIVLIAHPGGPLWADRDEGAWSLVKGELSPGEDPLAVALREFTEETGLPPPVGPFLDLGDVRQRGGKTVRAFAVEADVDVTGFRPGTITIPWRGRPLVIPEIDRIAWVDPDEARRLLNPAQADFVDRLLARIGEHGRPAAS